ncbi:SH2 domain-containing protein B-like isoform X3 [Lotus japonicus]|uniref:SH2 domain-containing protein B-like isoform X3 n=1 Tax=Lotus japonicus TaxID=34305 RepID=UPI0025851B66|nr:SH2 domain-containing protein B-like isoform X3 [Lotus japonicus]
MGTDSMGSEGYSPLKDLRLEIEVKERTFSLCFWVYLMNSTTFPATIIQQVYSDISQSAPFLVINENKRINILPVLHLHEEAPDIGNISSWTEVPHATADFEFPLEKWVHVGCEVCPNHIQLQINGEIVGKKSLSSLLNKEPNSSDLRKITLANVGGDGNSVHGYVHNFEVFPIISPVKDHHLKNPPLKLTIDESSASEIEEESDGVWGIVGGKASCRRNFSLDVVLSDGFGDPVDKENEQVFASLLYADTRAPVEKTIDEEAPLLVSYDGIEFSSGERPSKILLGRASFKLKISQLSSKCDNRLFLIRFCVPKLGDFPFLETFSRPIRCISRSRNTKLSTLVWKRPTSALHQLSLSQSSAMVDESLEHMQCGLESTANPLVKRFRVGHDKISVSVQPDEECNSHVWTANQNEFPTSMDARPTKFDEADDSPSDSESIGERNSPSNNMASRRYPISDMTIFKYCLAGLAERSLMLKEIAFFSSGNEILELAHHVSLYSGCSHHGNQILLAKRLIEDGTNLWKVLSPNNHHVSWESAVYEIEEKFMKIASCDSRSLSHQDLELLRRIAGCQEYLTQESFEKLWCWVYPVAFTISRDLINPIWNSVAPKWIEGLITKEEAEASLRGPAGFQEPGTFTLRFPTSRSWPHPDAGCLIVTYVGNDYKIHHRLLSMDHAYGSGDKRTDMKPLQDMLLEEPELSRLGRIIRSH